MLVEQTYTDVKALEESMLGKREFRMNEVIGQDDDLGLTIKALTRLILLAKNETGLKNLEKLSGLSRMAANIDEISPIYLEQFHEGLICILPFDSAVSKSLLQGDTVIAEKTAEWYRNLFGGDLYFDFSSGSGK